VLNRMDLRLGGGAAGSLWPPASLVFRRRLTAVCRYILTPLSADLAEYYDQLANIGDDQHLGNALWLVTVIGPELPLAPA
jgi:hypothetical protein